MLSESFRIMFSDKLDKLTHRQDKVDMLHIYSPAHRFYSTPMSILTDAWGSGLAAVVQEAHICQAVSIIHTAASL